MPRGQVQRIQDSVHGLMEFRGMETLIVDLLRTPEIQRLRRIRQLGLAHLVFPGAEHSRLVHSLGASWLAIKFVRQLIDATHGFLIEILRPSPSSVRDVAVAALCHDLGHGPLSHAWENVVIGKHFDITSWASALGLSQEQQQRFGKAKWHELVTYSLLLWPEGQLHRLLEETESTLPERIVEMLNGRYYLQYLPRLLSGDVDVDRADFLKRDTYQSGVAYGQYDLNWLISTCTVGRNQYDGLVVGFDERKALRVLEQFLIARQALYESVYYHKTVHSAEGMVGLFLQRLRDVLLGGGAITAEPMLAPYITAISGGALTPQQLLTLDDFSLFVLIDAIANNSAADVTARDLGRRILARDLFKMVPCSDEQIEELLAKPDGYDRIFDALKPFCTGDPRYYLVTDRVHFNMLNSERSQMAYVVTPGRDATPIQEHNLFRNFARSTRRTRLFTVAHAVDAVKRCIVG